MKQSIKYISYTMLFIFSFSAVFIGIHFLFVPKVSSIQPSKVYINPSFPDKNIYHAFFQQKGYLFVNTMKNADIAIDTNPFMYAAKAIPIYTKIYALTTNFTSLDTDISTSTWQSLIQNKKLFAIDNTFPFATVLSMSAPRAQYMIMPFDQLSDMYKTLSINTIMPLDKQANLDNYPLKIIYQLSIKQTEDLTPALKSFLSDHITSNFHKDQLHSVIMTGTTALARGVYFYTKRYGTAYPAQYVADIMKHADITHVSIETSFNPTCTQQVGTLQFCALPESLQTLQDAGVNLVELTGNHNNDFGSEYNTQSIALYDKNNIKHFGGGINTNAAHTPAVFSLNGITFAFLGYNQPGPSYAFATDTTAGAARLDETQMVQDIQKAKAMYDVVFVDVQWQNENNQYPDPLQVTISREAIDAGADIVTGSQAHRPQGMEFYHGKLIMYGLGNLFFDQMENLDTRQNVIVKHTFYGKNLISTQLIPTLLYNYSQPQPVSGKDASAVLNQIFQASTNLN